MQCSDIMHDVLHHVRRIFRSVARGDTSETPPLRRLHLPALTVVGQNEQLAHEPIESIRRVGKSILVVVVSLNKAGWVHGDIKPRHTCQRHRRSESMADLPRGSALYTLLDFDLCKRAGDPDDWSQRHKLLGSSAFLPSEVHHWLVDDANAGTTTHFAGRDLWGFGCTLYEMVSGESLFRNRYDDVRTSSSKEQHTDYIGLPADTRTCLSSLHGPAESAPLIDILEWLLDPSAGARPTVDPAAQHVRRLSDAAQPAAFHGCGVAF